MGKTWSVGIFKEKNGFAISQKSKPGELIFSLSGRTIRTNTRHIHTYADPFLFENNENLYLFAEIQSMGKPGYINCWQYKEDSNWLDIGSVVKESSHYSYPFIIKDKDGQIYMIPESVQTNDIGIWKFENFPFGIKRIKTLLKGSYADSNIIYHDGTYYLFTTNMANELLIFFSDKLLSDTWTQHPDNPISTDRRISRNGGGIMLHENKLIRIAQNCADRYGEGIIILNVLRLDKTGYKEAIHINDYQPQNHYSWQKKGRHHLNLCNFKGNTFIAMDGGAEDLVINKFINGFYKLLKR